LGRIPARNKYDAIVVGSGPNGLAASITIAQTGRTVLLIEQKDTIGGGVRTAELTLPGFLHDICSAIHPMAAASPFFLMLDLAKHGLEWVYPPASVAHPLDDGTAVLLERSVEATAENLGVDKAAYQKLMLPLVNDWDRLASDLLGPLRLPYHPLALLRFGKCAMRSVRGLAESSFGGERARALFAGLGAHSILPLEQPSSAAVGLVLGILGHTVGWPVAKGGSQKIADALAEYLLSQGGEIVSGLRVESLDGLPQARVVLMDLTPRQLLRVAGNSLPSRYRQMLEDHPYGPGVFKVDWALDGPIPWKATECARAATVHVGGTLEEIAASESAVWKGKHPERPFVLLAQQSLFDPTRAPKEKHTAWGYCHVPNGSRFDMTERIESQIEFFAPGFRDRVLARKVMSPTELEDYNPNYSGGDIAGGVQSFWRVFARPAIRRKEYSTPVKGLYVCSSSTPPGAGVHGMCGYHAARRALHEMF
jgi:phytoene dehydrogenase-like protein